MDGLKRRIVKKAIGIAMGATILVGGMGVGPAMADVRPFGNGDPYAHGITQAECGQGIGVMARAAMETRFKPGFWRTTLYFSSDYGRTWHMVDNTKPWVQGGLAMSQQYQFTRWSTGTYGIYHHFWWNGMGAAHTHWEVCSAFY